MNRALFALSVFSILSSARADTLNIEQSGAYVVRDAIPAAESAGAYLLSGKVKAVGLAEGSEASVQIFFGDILLEELKLSSGAAVSISKSFSLSPESLLVSDLTLDAIVPEGAKLVFEDLKISPSKEEANAASSAAATSNGNGKTASGASASFAYVNGSNVISAKDSASSTNSAQSAKLAASSKTASSAGIIYVNSDTGDNSFTGTIDAPKLTIAAALSAASDGDVIVLQSSPKVYRAPNVFRASGKRVIIRPASRAIIRGN